MHNPKKTRRGKMKRSPHYVDNVVLMSKATLEMSSPFKDVKVAFNWLNRDYPRYHGHSHWELLVVMSGEISQNLNGMKAILKRGDVCLIKPKDKHSLNFIKKDVKNYQHINFIFSDELAEEFFSIYGCYDEIVDGTEPVYFTIDNSDIAMIYEKALLAQTLPQEQYEACAKIMVSKIMLEYIEQKTLFNAEYPEWLNAFLSQLSNPINFNLKVEELAQTTSYSYSRLSRLFKQHMGVTIVDYLNEKKMIYAKRLLRSTDLSTLQIAERIGYNSLSSFNHLFKKAYGVTPSEYRKKRKND